MSNIAPQMAANSLAGDFQRLLNMQKAHFQEIVRHTTAAQRIDKLNRIKKWILANQQLIRDAVFADFKKPEAEVDSMDIKPVLSAIEDTKANLRTWMDDKAVAPTLLFTGASAKIVHEPKGCALIIAPWNFPFMLAIEPLVSAISAGCCVVLKPSELTPNTAQLIYKLVNDVFEEQEIAVRLGDAQVAKALLSLPFDHIFFTGSPLVGREVMRAAAEHLTSVTLELGGINPVIVDETADIRDTAEKLIWGKFINCGQSCMSINYVNVHHTVYDRLVKELQAALVRMYGEPDDIADNPDFGRIVNARHAARIKTLIDGSIDAGARLVCGGFADEKDNLIAPTILKDVPDDAPLMHEEIFGPILALRKYKDVKDVIQLINSKPKPLALYIFSASNKTVNMIIDHTSAGTTCVNDTTIPFIHPNLPFGGVNWSGIGKAHGHYGFMAFTNERSVVQQRRGMTSFKLVYPPYTTKVKQTIQLVMKYL
jgi:aldehyde dehydrogenase (NAD+)